MEADTLDLRSIFDLLRRRFWIVLVAVVMCLGIAGLALLALKPIYSSTALILVDPSKKNLLDPDAQLGGSSSDSLRVDSEVELVKSETTLLSVAQQLNLPNDPEFGPKIGMRDQLGSLLRISEPKLPTGEEALGRVVDKLRAAVTVQRRGLTFLIAVAARSERPQFAAQMANAIARTYIAEQLQAKIASTLDSASILRSRTAEASATVAESEGAFDEFIDQNIDDIAESTGRSDLTDIRDQIQSLNQFRTQGQSVADAAEDSLAARDWSSLAQNLQDEALSNLQTQRDQLLVALQSAPVGSATAADFEAELASLDDQLNDTATRAVGNLRQELTQSQARAIELRDELRDTILASNLPSQILTSIYELQQSAEVARAQYQTLLTRQKDLETQAYLQVADSRLVSEATPPTNPSFPNPRLILTLAGLAGLGIGIGLAFLIEHFVGGLTSAAQAESILRVPVATSIPRQKSQRTGTYQSVADALVMSPLSAFSESIRRIRIGIDQALRASGRSASGQGVVIVVSSAAPAEGKTTVALALARAYSLAGVSTLLVDCDLRKPSIHRQLGLQASEGLLEYLVDDSGVTDLKSILTVDSGSGAQVIVGSRRSDVPTDQLVGGRTFARLISAARKNFEVVVLDTPPVSPVVDGLYLAGMADAIAFVVKFSGTPQQEVKAALNAILQAKPADAPLLTVLNQQDTNPASYRGKYAGYYGEA